MLEFLFNMLYTIPPVGLLSTKTRLFITGVSMETQEFGVRLRQLRNQAGMTQRGLVERVKIDFSYLSKIESGVVPPPSEKVISQLAEALNANKDELIILAGKVPSDIVEILKNRETLQRLRSANAQQIDEL